MADNNNQQLQIELKPEVAEGTYSNLAILTHSSSEFVADFIQMMPGMQKAQVRSRIIMAPEHAKRLLPCAMHVNLTAAVSGGLYLHSFGSGLHGVVGVDTLHYEVRMPVEILVLD